MGNENSGNSLEMEATISKNAYSPKSLQYEIDKFYTT